MTSPFLQSLMSPHEKEQLDSQITREFEIAFQEEENYCALEEMGLDEEYNTNKTIHEVLQETRAERNARRRN